MVAVDGKDLDALLGQAVEQTGVVELGRQIVGQARIDVTGNEDGVDLFFYGNLDDLLESPERCPADDALPSFVRNLYILERTAQMKISAVNET